MRALVLHGDYDICGSDFHGYSGENGRRHPGQIMGHETVGRIRGLADLVAVPAANIVSLPDDTPAELGALVEPLAVCHMPYAVSTEERTLIGSFTYTAEGFAETAAWVGSVPDGIETLIRAWSAGTRLPRASTTLPGVGRRPARSWSSRRARRHWSRSECASHGCGPGLHRGRRGRAQSRRAAGPGRDQTRTISVPLLERFHTVTDDRTPIVEPLPLERLLADLPPELEVGTNLDVIRAGRRLVVLDDDPTGTQSIADLPVLTSWTVADFRWALQQPTTGFFVLTNTRSLAEADAAERNREIVAALDEASQAEGVPYVILSRSDSTLRGYYPLETDVLAEELSARGTTTDGVVICPAYIEPGRITIDSVHWSKVAAGMIPVARSEFAKDASFGYSSSDLRDWVEEKTAGRIGRDEVAAVTIADIRGGGPDRVQEILSGLHDGQPVVVDTTCDADLQVVVLALLRAEDAGKRFIYRTGPSFVRARSGQVATPAIDAERLRGIIAAQPRDPADQRPSSDRGLIAIGSHVGLTTRQLDRLRETGKIIELELDVPTLLDADARDAHVTAVAAEAARLLQSEESDSDIVVRTSRTLIKGADADHSLVIARSVSSALVGTVREIVGQIRPAFVVAKGGITSSDTATEGLSIRRAWSRGTMLPGIVSLWEPVSGPAQGIPYIVFAGNVGDDEALATVVATLRTV